MSNITCEHRDKVRLITINRPDVMNSMDFEANDDLVEVWREFQADPEARVAVITGTGDQSFCAGADLKTYTQAFIQHPAPEFRDRYTNGPGFGGITRNMDIFKPVIAAVNGYAISGGFELALACDLRFASPNAQFGLQDARWGFHPCDGGLIRLPQIVGLGHAMEIILSADLIDCEAAYRMGIVNRIIPCVELLDYCLNYAENLSRRAPLSHRMAKEVMKRAVGMPFDEAMRLESRSFRDVGESTDLKEGLAAFREKRDANFNGT